MTNLLQRGAAFHARTMPRAAGRCVTYTRPGEGSVSLVAWTDWQENETVGDDGLVTVVRSLAFCCEACDLGLTPRAGDIIEDRDGQRYQVLPQSGKPCYEFLDVDGISLLIRTKRIA